MKKELRGRSLEIVREVSMAISILSYGWKNMDYSDSSETET